MKKNFRDEPRARGELMYFGGTINTTVLRRGFAPSSQDEYSNKQCMEGRRPEGKSTIDLINTARVISQQPYQPKMGQAGYLDGQYPVICLRWWSGPAALGSRRVGRAGQRGPRTPSYRAVAWARPTVQVALGSLGGMQGRAGQLWAAKGRKVGGRCRCIAP